MTDHDVGVDWWCAHGIVRTRDHYPDCRLLVTVHATYYGILASAIVIPVHVPATRSP